MHEWRQQARVLTWVAAALFTALAVSGGVALGALLGRLI
jgi:hypothetical protein